MPIKEYVKSLRGERIDQPDFQHVAETGPKDTAAQVAEEVLIGRESTLGGTLKTQPDAFILEGFSVSVAGLVLTINGGRAILSTRDERGQQNGHILSGGDTQKSIDLTSFADATYGVFIRFSLRETAFQNRIFWNASAPTPVEVPRNIGTRLTEAWDVVIEQVSPGSEWTRVADVQKAAGALTPTDRRVFFFEGEASNQHVVVDAEFGGNNDRADNRALEGVFGFRRAMRGLQRQVQDIIGGSDPVIRHWARAIDASKGLYEMFARDGSRDLAGNLNPDAPNSREIGNLRRFLNAVFQNSTIELLTLFDKLAGSPGDDLVARLLAIANVSTAGHPTGVQQRQLLGEFQVRTGTDAKFRLYLSSGVAQYGSTTVSIERTIELTCNARWNVTAPNSAWVRDTGSTAAWLIAVANDGQVRLLSKAAPPAAGWRDDGAPGDTWDNGNRGLVYIAQNEQLILGQAALTNTITGLPFGTLGRRNVAVAGGSLQPATGGGVQLVNQWGCTIVDGTAPVVNLVLNSIMATDGYSTLFHANRDPGTFGFLPAQARASAKTQTGFLIEFYRFSGGTWVLGDIGAEEPEINFIVHGLT